MKNKSINIFSGLMAVTAIGLITLGFSSGCKSHAAKDNPKALAPVTQPLPAQPATVQPPPPTLEPAPAAATLKAQPAPIAAPATTPAIPDVKPDTSTYTVQKGDTFSKIARQYGIDMKKLADYNKMSLQQPLKIGVTLKIPQK